MDSTGPRSSRQQRRAAARRRAKSAAAPPQPARGIATALAALGAGLAAQPALATTFTVNTNADGAPVADANLTLREAVQQANAAAGPDVIQFAPGLSGQTITLDNTQGQIPIKDSLDIQGLGSAQLTVSGNDNQRIFYIYSPSPLTPITVSISGLTLRDGASGLNNDGGAIMSLNANLQITDSILTENQAGEDGGAVAFKAYGDGDVSTILQDSLTLTRTQVTLNAAAFDGGGVSFYGGGEGADVNGVSTYAGNLTIDGTTFDQNTAGFYGGGLRVEDAHSVTVRDSFLTANQATDVDNGRGGGAFIDDTNALDILRTEITGNTAGFDAGGLMLYNLYGSGTIADGRISNNGALVGGGVELYSIDLYALPSATLRFDRMEIAGNQALGAAGVWVRETAGPPPVLSQTTVSGNTAFFDAGGLAVTGYYYDGGSGVAALTVVDSTISGNTATGGNGGGIYVPSGPYYDAYGAVDVRHSTVVGNSAGEYGGGLFVGYGAPPQTVAHTILAGNTAPTGPDEYSSSGDGGSPRAVDLSWSLVGDDTDASFNSITGNQLNLSPVLGPLQANGGPTLTHKPLPASPAINAGDPAVAGEPATDQRGFARKVGVIDVGAVEINPGTFELSINPTSVTEGGGPVVVTVNRVGGQDGAVSVELNFSNGSATNPADWSAPNAVVNFADNDVVAKTFNVTIVDDATPEADETFSAALANPTGGAQLGVTTSGTVTIHDNDSLPVVEVPALDDAGKALLIGLVAAAAVVFLRRRKGLGTALILTVALTAGAAEAGSEKPRQPAATRALQAPAAARPFAGTTRVPWRWHAAGAHRESVEVAAIDASSVTFKRADGSLVKVKLSLVSQEGAGRHDRSLLKVNAKVRVKLRVGPHGEILKAKLKATRPGKLR